MRKGRQAFREEHAAAGQRGRSGRLATRYDESATVYPAALHIAGILIWSAR
jgi:transposase